MSTYATKQKFGRKRAAVGDSVVIAMSQHIRKHEYAFDAACLQAGVIVSVSKHEDRPHIRVVKTGETNYDNKELDWKFVACLSEADVERLEIGEWTWPLRKLDDER